MYVFEFNTKRVPGGPTQIDFLRFPAMHVYAVYVFELNLVATLFEIHVLLS
jgi:hypothetical protein